MKKITLIITTAIITAFAAPPVGIPGDILTNEILFEHMMSRRAAPIISEHPDLPEEEPETEPSRLPQHSWQSLPIYDQLASDPTPMAHGQGMLFVPRMSAVGNYEPNFYILNSEGERIVVGETGKRINLLPGIYTLTLPDNLPFDVSKSFEILEGEITPIMPPWTAVRIEVIDEGGMPIRGEYDLAMLDPLMAIGRGRGRDIDLAEELRIWFLPVGYYKIIGVGSPLNTISNFLTFRVVNAGEFMRFTVVQDVETNRIVGGGTLFADIIAGAHRRNNPWSNTINIGGSIDFNYHRDFFSDTTSNLTKFTLLLFTRSNYSKDKLEIMNLARIDVSFLLEDMRWRTMRTTSDEFRINSLFTYRLFPRSGPYWRGEFSSSTFPQTANFYSTALRRNNGTNSVSAEARHYFLLFDDIPDIIDDNSAVDINSTATSMVISPAFSPIQLQTGGGYNVQIFRNRMLNMRFLSGTGLEYERQWNSWRVVSERYLNFDTESAIYRNIYNTNIDRITLERNNGERFDYGPEFLLNYFAYFSRTVSLDGNIRLFMPITRFDSPDFRAHTLLSFRLTRFFNIDYDYTFDLIQASQEELRVKSNRHRVLARFSFARR